MNRFEHPRLVEVVPICLVAFLIFSLTTEKDSYSALQLSVDFIPLFHLCLFHAVIEPQEHTLLKMSCVIAPCSSCSTDEYIFLILPTTTQLFVDAVCTGACPTQLLNASVKLVHTTAHLAS